jgi:hypothetical protein
MSTRFHNSSPPACGEQTSELSKGSEKFDLTYSHIGMYYPLHGESGYNL